jgi:hypothetical protein
MTNFRVRIKFEPRDCWVGVYWTHDGYDCFRAAINKYGCSYAVYVCLVPCFPIVIRWHVPGTES